MTKVFIHSWHGDFARTRIVSEIEYLGRAAKRDDPPLRLFACGCDARHLQRIHRSALMRLVPFFRLYHCDRCGADVFRPRTSPRRGYPQY